MTGAYKNHRLYDIAFGYLREEARKQGKTLKAVAQDNNYSGKVLRRGTPGAFGKCRNNPAAV